MAKTGNSSQTDKPHLFKPGKSGNPNGRPKTPQEVRDAFRSLTLLAKQTLEDVMKDKTSGASARVKAAEVAMNRAWGTPEQSIALSGQVAQVQIDSSKLPQDQQDALLEALGSIITQENIESTDTE